MVSNIAIVHSAPSVFPTKKHWSKSQLCSKRISSKGPSPENFLTSGGYLECNTNRITVLGWLKKEEDEDAEEEERQKERRKRDEQF